MSGSSGEFALGSISAFTPAWRTALAMARASSIGSCHRFLQQNMLAGLDRLQCKRDMGARRSQDKDSVDVGLFDHLIIGLVGNVLQCDVRTTLAETNREGGHISTVVCASHESIVHRSTCG